MEKVRNLPVYKESFFAESCDLNTYPCKIVSIGQNNFYPLKFQKKLYRYWPATNIVTSY